MTAAINGDGGILVVAVQRELRRHVFDAMDHAGYPNIHSARDVLHAAILLEGSPPLQLMVAVFPADGAQLGSYYAQLRRLPGGSQIPLIAILTRDCAFSPVDLPPGVSDWIYADQLGVELLARWRRWLSLSSGAASTKPASIEHGVHEGYRYLFDEGDIEWLIVDVLTHRVVEVNATVMRHSGLRQDQWQGLLLKDVLRSESTDIDTVLLESDGRWHPCQRKSSRGFEAGQVSARHVGDESFALIFRSHRADLRAEAALSLLSRIFASPDGGDTPMAAAQLLFDELELDYLAIWSVRQNSVEAMQAVVQLWKGAEQIWPPAHLQVSLQRVLGGNPVLYRTDASRLAATDPLPQQLGLAGFAGMPLYDERHTVLGAMLAGSRSSFAELGIIEPVLLCASARFAQTLELNWTREQGRAAGLVDALTGLPNRLLFNDRLDTIIHEATRHGECFAVLFIDLDYFKTVNDTYGHAAGDQVLRMAAQRLSGSVRASDTVARYAGDEFIVVLRHVIKTDDVLRMAEKIVQVMEAPLQLDDGTELQATVSMGLSFFPDDAGDAPTLLKHADEAMYAAKHRGRNNFSVYEVSPESARQHGTALRSRLRQAQSHGELRVVYQPQVDTVSEDIVGMEALARWEHPELGMISPAVFIPLAEETGLITSIGEWVMQTACQQAREWEVVYGMRLRLGVNLSVMQLMEPQLVDTVQRILRDTNMDPTLLELEITESISIKAVPNLVENLNTLHAMGCHIAIDDFGTGAASLDYLRKLPADRIKIDQSFVRNIGIDPDDEAIVRATIEMAHRMQRGVVAEGVETEQHFEFLRAHHCDELQGYLFCRPLPPISFGSLLAERRRLLNIHKVETT